jgi:hypothetical protein
MTTILAYNKNNFSWSSSNIDINEDFCKGLDNNCTSDKCKYHTQLCDNYTLYNNLKGIQTKHSGSDVRYNDINNQYKNEIANTVKFSIGIMGMLYLYWRLR